MPHSPPSALLELRVGVDVGSRCHAVAIGLPDGTVLDEFEISHEPEGFRHFFSRIERHAKRHGLPVAVAMEGYNGLARPLDTLVQANNWRLFNVNNLKLARFKEIFPGAAKNDHLDSRKTLELFQLQDHLPLAKRVLQEVETTPEENVVLKRLTRRRRSLVEERVRLLNALQADLQAVCPGLLAITGDAGNVWFLGFLTCRKGLAKLARVRRKTLLAVRGIGAKYADTIQAWQKQAFFAPDVEWVGDMIQEDAERILELSRRIKDLEDKIEPLVERSSIARLLRTIPGFGLVSSAEIAGEIGSLMRFRNEASLALYLGMATLDNSSGRRKGSKPPRHVNTRAKAAMMAAVDNHRKQVPQSRRYYDRKRVEGKKHNQAVRALARQLCRIIFRMIRDQRPYRLDP